MASDQLQLYKAALPAGPQESITRLLANRLALLKVKDLEAIREVAAAIRGVMEGIAIPEEQMRPSTTSAR